MPVDSKHPEYSKYSPMHVKCRDAYEGEDAVKAKTTTYLPLLSGMTAGGSKYLAYLVRAQFYSATRRTVEGLAGVIDRKPPVVEITDGLPWADDIDGEGMDLPGFANQITTEAVLTGWQGIFIDRRDGYEYPYPVQYTAEQIINWRFENGTLVMVMLYETVYESDDGYEQTAVEQWRELQLIDGMYTVTIHRRDDKTKKFFEHQVFVPTERGASLDYIPFVFVSANNRLENPPLLDMVNVNFHHYKNSADYEHGVHFTGLPTPYITGLQQQTDELGNNITIELGSETCILIPEANGKAGFMEFTGQGLSALEKAMETKKQEMASLGARLLQTDKKAAEAAETARINKSGDSNVISRIVSGVERGLNEMLEIMSAWQGVSPEQNTIELNHDFVDVEMSPQELTALVGAWQAGAMSKETLVYNFQKKELLPDGVSVDDELEKIDTEPPKMTGGNPINVDAEDEDEVEE